MPYDLDVDTPEKVPQILRQAAEAYDNSQGELEAAWQDKKAGKIWRKIASKLDSVADSIDTLIAKEM